MARLVIVVKREAVEKLFPHLNGVTLRTNGELAMFRSGAKLYKGNRHGDWIISGYDSRGDDVGKAVTELMATATK